MYSSSNSSLTFVFILVQSATFVLWWYQFLLKDANIFKHSFISYAKKRWLEQWLERWTANLQATSLNLTRTCICRMLY